MEANVAGADDALMLDGRGFVAETNATHLFAVVGGALHTPRTVACPEGITRQTVLDLAARHGDRGRGARHLADRDVHGRRGVLHRHDGRDRRRSPRSTAGRSATGKVGPVTRADRRALPGARHGRRHAGAVRRSKAAWSGSRQSRCGGQLVVVRPGLLDQVAQPVRHHRRRRVVRREPGRRLHRGVPVRRPHAVGVAAAGRPATASPGRTRCRAPRTAGPARRPGRAAGRRRRPPGRRRRGRSRPAAA